MPAVVGAYLGVGTFQEGPLPSRAEHLVQPHPLPKVGLCGGYLHPSILHITSAFSRIQPSLQTVPHPCSAPPHAPAWGNPLLPVSLPKRSLRNSKNSDFKNEHVINALPTDTYTHTYTYLHPHVHIPTPMKTPPDYAQ